MAKKILLADDSITIQKVVELTFAEGDYEVICASDGAHAIRKIEEIVPDIALVDVMMPQRNGYDVCAHVKKDPNLAWIPVLLLTGTFEPYDPKRAEEVGADGHIIKPFESRALVGQVEELISRLPRPGSEPREEAPAEAEPAPEPTPVGPATVRIDSRELFDQMAPAGGAEPGQPPSPPSLGPLDLGAQEPAVESTHPVSSVMAEEEKPPVADEPALPAEEAGRSAPPGPAVADDDVTTVARERIEEIARPIIEEAVDRVLQEIAWEVIPELAEKIIRRRVRELEDEVDSPEDAPLH